MHYPEANIDYRWVLGYIVSLKALHWVFEDEIHIFFSFREAIVVDIHVMK